MSVTTLDEGIKINPELWKHFEAVASKIPVSKPMFYLGIIYDDIVRGIKKHLGDDFVFDRDEILGLIDSIQLPPEYDKVPFYWISWIIQNRTLYYYLTRYHPRKQELLDALEYENWYGAIHYPRKQELIGFINNLMYKQVDFFNECADRLRYIKPNSSRKILDYYKQIGIRQKHFIRRGHPNSKLTTVQLNPYFVWDEWGLMFGSLNTKVLSMHHFCADDNLDIAVWLSNFKKWTHGKTTYEYKGVPVRIHHHNLIKYLELPKTDKGYDIRIHPKDWLKENKQAEIDALVAKTHSYIYTEFDKNEVIEKVLANWENVRLLRTAQDIIREADKMEHCVDGSEYVEMAKEGIGFYFHFDFPQSKGATLGLCYNRKHDEYNILEYSGFQNEKIPVEQAVQILDFVNEINQTHWSK